MKEKEAYYFSHDSNARRDPNILAMRSVYGSEGYGWFWILIEMMRDQTDYKLDMSSKYAYHAFASEMDCKPEISLNFISDCINEFHLFASDGIYFWSNSLLRRMNMKEIKSELARQSANARWNPKAGPDKENKESDTVEECEKDANASKIDAIKESKVKETKEDKIKYAEFVIMAEIEYQKLVDQYGLKLTTEMISVLDNYKGSHGKRYKSDYRAILSWVAAKVTDKQKVSNQAKNDFVMQLIKEAEERERV